MSQPVQSHPAVRENTSNIPTDICCGRCLFRSDKKMKTTANGQNKYLCRFNPPSIVLRGEEYVPVLPIVRDSDFCSNYIDRNTKKTFEVMLNIE